MYPAQSQQFLHSSYGQCLCTMLRKPGQTTSNKSFQSLSYYSTIYAQCLPQSTTVAMFCFACESFCMHVPYFNKMLVPICYTILTSLVHHCHHCTCYLHQFTFSRVHSHQKGAVPIVQNTYHSSVHHFHQCTRYLHHSVGKMRYSVHYCTSTESQYMLQKQQSCS